MVEGQELLAWLPDALVAQRRLLGRGACTCRRAVLAYAAARDKAMVGGRRLVDMLRASPLHAMPGIFASNLFQSFRTKGAKAWVPGKLRKSEV